MKKIQKKLRSDEPLRGRARALELVDYLIKHGTMRIVHEINDDKYLIKTAKNAYADGDDDNILVEVVKQKAENILDLLNDPDKLKVARKDAAELRARVTGETFTGNKYGGSSGSDKYGGFDAGSYKRDDFNEKKKFDDFKRDEYRGNSSKYDDYGESDLYKKLGIKPPSGDDANANSKSNSNQEPDYSKDEATKNNDTQGEGQGLKSLPPPPSKNNSMGLPKPPMKGEGFQGLPKPPAKNANNTKSSPNNNQKQDMDDILGGDDLLGNSNTVTEVNKPKRGLPAPPSKAGNNTQVTANAQNNTNSNNNNLFEFDFFGGDSQNTNNNVNANMGSNNTLGMNNNMAMNNNMSSNNNMAMGNNMAMNNNINMGMGGNNTTPNKVPQQN